jgi:hypothetical protein
MCDLFSNAVSSSECAASNDKIINKSERRQTEEMAVQLKVICWHQPGKTEENHEIPQCG